MSPGLAELCFYPAAAGDPNPQCSVFLEDRFLEPQTFSGSTERFRPRTGQLVGAASRAGPTALLEKHRELAVAQVNWRAPLRCRRPFARIGCSFGQVAVLAANLCIPRDSRAFRSKAISSIRHDHRMDSSAVNLIRNWSDPFFCRTRIFLILYSPQSTLSAAHCSMEYSWRTQDRTGVVPR